MFVRQQLLETPNHNTSRVLIGRFHEAATAKNLSVRTFSSYKIWKP